MGVAAGRMVSAALEQELGGAARPRAVFADERRDVEQKVPWLGDIPGLGHLFKSTSKTDNKDELLIFVTPRILREGTNLY